MKKILFLLLVIMPFVSKAQTSSTSKGIHFVSVGLPNNPQPGDWYFHNDTFYFYTSTNTWRKVYQPSASITTGDLNGGSGVTIGTGTNKLVGGSSTVSLDSTYWAKLWKVNTKLDKTGTAANSSLLQGKDSSYIKTYWSGTKVDTTKTPLAGHYATQYDVQTKQTQLNGTGFVKASGSTISYDNSTYLTTTYFNDQFHHHSTTTFTGSDTLLSLRYMNDSVGVITVNNNLSFSPNLTTARSGATSIVEFKGNNTNTLRINNVDGVNGSEFVNTTNTVNTYMFAYAGRRCVGNLLTTYVDNTSPPLLASAFINNTLGKNKVNLKYNLTLSTGSVPSTTDFSITENGSPKTVASVAINYDSVKITTSTNFSPSTIVILNYTPGSNPIKSTYNVNAGSLSGQSVTNSVSNPVTLSAPSGLTATPVSGSQINLSWSNVTNNTGYAIYDSTSGMGQRTLLNTTITNATNYSHSGLPLSTTYYYWLKTNADGVNYLTSAYSSPVSATTNSATQLTTPTTTIIGSWNTSIEAYSTSDANASGYNFRYSTDNSNWTTAPQQSVNSYVFTGLNTCTSYYLQSQKVGIGGYSNSNWSSSATTTTTACAPTLSSAATNATGDTINLTFNKAMQASPSSTGLSLSTSSISSITRYASNTSILKLAVTPSWTSSTTGTISYTPGTIAALDSGVLASFSNISVTNNVVNETDFSFTLTGISQAGTVYTGTGTGFSDQKGVSSYALTGDFYVVCDIVSTSTDRGIIGLSAASTNDMYTAYLFMVYNNITHYKIGYSGGNLTDVTPVPVNNDRMRLRRVGTTVYADYYRSGTWTNMYTFSGSSSGTLYFHMDMGANGHKVSNPKHN